MAKKNGRKSTKMVSPLYESGRMNGPAAGPSGGIPVRDPLGYQSQSGQSAPGGSPADRQSGPPGEAATAH